jgi:YD repeat-containing protein
MILHQKENHFVAIQAQDGDRYKIYDPAQGATRWIASSVLEAESTGYGLIPKQLLTQHWRVLDTTESSKVWGAAWCSPGPNPDDSHGPDSPTKDDECKGGNGMPGYSFYLVEAGLGISDTPLAYTAPKGPQIGFKLTYNQRDANQPQTFTYTNWGPKWTSNWISYLIPNQANQSIKHYRAGGGQLTFALIPLPTGGTVQSRVERVPGSGAVIHLPSGKQQVLDSKTVKAMKDQGKLLPQVANPRLAAQGKTPMGTSGSSATFGDWIESRTNEFIRSSGGGGYVMYKPDGSSEIYGKSDGATPPKYFLSGRVDSAGNAISIDYDASMRIISIVDALGQTSTFTYGYAGDPTRVTQITDPFGRMAKFSYNSQGLLESVTDAEGMTSSFGYGGVGGWAAYGGSASYSYQADFISSMTTPYGTTTFNTYSSYEWLGIEAKDPLGYVERAEYRVGAPGLAYQDPTPPPGVYNSDLTSRNSFFWDKRVMAFAPTDYTKARVYHWLNGLGYEETWPVLESEKKPLDSRIWYLYPGQPAPNKQGSIGQPSSVLRILGDGSVQQTLNGYNSFGKLTSTQDPSGRTTSYNYSADGLDLLEVRNITAGRNELLATYTYNVQHRPLTATDASGSVTTFTYNAAGQVTTIQNPKSEVTTLSYDPNGYLTKVEGAIAGSATTFTYDAVGRVRTVTGPDAFTVQYDYDNLDRRTKVTYPDSTTESTYFDKLDVGATVDRKGQWTYMTYNPIRQLVEVKDSQGRVTRMDWCGCGQLEGLVDSMGRFTNWQRDLQGRVQAKIFPDLKSTKYGYDTSSRLVSRVDAKGQVTTYTYFIDGNLQQVTYSGGTTSTPSMSYTYDSAYNRLATMLDGTGTTNYSYLPMASTAGLGAGRLATVSNTLANGTSTYGYDELGRVRTRDIGGSTESRQFDALGRMSTVTNPLGTFIYAYDGLTNRLKTITYPNGQTTSLSYFDSMGSQRLKQIVNTSSTSTNISTFDYTYDANGQILTWSQKADAQGPKVQTFTYDAVGQLLGAQLHDGSPTGNVLKSYLYAYDEGGNRLSEQIDGQLSVSSFNTLNQLTGQRTSTVSAPITVQKGGKARTTTKKPGSTTSKKGLPQQKTTSPP